MLLSLLLAIWSARRIARPIEQIEQGTHALMLRRAISFSNTGLPEADRTLDALASTARVFEQHDKERDEREAHVRLIMRELSHRSKNLLAIVLAIARQTSRHTTSFSDFESRFNSRIQALADAHDLLVEQQWSGALIDDLVRAQLAAFGMEKVTCRGERDHAAAPRRCRTSRWRCTSSPPTPRNTARCRCRPARSTSTGRGRPARPGERDLRLTWRESGGPPVDGAEPEGFRLLRAGARHGQCARRRQARVQSGRAWSGPASSGRSIWSMAQRGDAAPKQAAAASPQAAVS